MCALLLSDESSWITGQVSPSTAAKPCACNRCHLRFDGHSGR
jgi:hypothetical protein